MACPVEILDLKFVMTQVTIFKSFETAKPFQMTWEHSQGSADESAEASGERDYQLLHLTLKKKEDEEWSAQKEWNRTRKQVQKHEGMEQTEVSQREGGEEVGRN